MSHSNSSNTIELITLIVVITILVLGLTGKFVNPSTSLTKADVVDAVKTAMANVGNPVPSANPVPRPAPTPTPPAPSVTKADMDDVKKLYETSYILGNKDAPVTVIEFSDFECPFCQRHSNNDTLGQVLAKYGDDVNVIFTHFPLSFHPLAPKAQEAVECIGEQGGTEAFYAFKKGVFATGEKPTREVLERVAGDMDNIDIEAFKQCLDEGKYAQKVADAMNLGRKWGVTGTPGNIVMNNKTGEFIKVSGAVPASAFDGPINTLLGK